jgi:hypothetical protein
MGRIIEYLDNHPQIKKLNENIKPNQGWQSAFEKDKKAGLVA